LVTDSRGDIKFFAICFAKLFYEVKTILDRVGSNPNLTSQELQKWFNEKMEEVRKQIEPEKVLKETIVNPLPETGKPGPT
jgi:hypothetical protein